MTEPTDDLQQRCAEVEEWQRTGVLPGNALCNYAEAHWAGRHDSLQMAERDTSAQAMQWIAKFGTPPVVAAEPVKWIGASSHHLLKPTQAQAGAVPLPKSYQASVLTSNSHGSGCRVSFSFGSVAEAEAWHESLIDQHHGITDGPNGKSA